MALLKTVSTPQIANEKSIEKTATNIINFCASGNGVQVTLFLSSSNDSFTYVIKLAIVIFNVISGLQLDFYEINFFKF